MDVEEDVQACLAPLPVLFSYIVSTGSDVDSIKIALRENITIIHTFYQNNLVVDCSKPESLVGDGDKDANLGRCEALSIFKVCKCAGTPFHDLWSNSEMELSIESS